MKIGIVGLGLIGGSLGLKLQRLNHTIYGVTNNKNNQEQAKKRKLANFVSCDLKIIKDCSCIILALPIKDLINPSQELIRALPRDAIITDVGSIKDPIIKKWETVHPLFIGSHPMAGTEKQGVDSGHVDLFKSAKWVITPTSQSDSNAIKRLSNLIKSMDCEIYEATPEEHDEAVSLISHLPIFLASALIETANKENNRSLLNLTKQLAASGFDDSTRVGGGNPQLGLDLAINNQTNVLNALAGFQQKISELEIIIKEKKWELLSKKLLKAKEVRASFIN